VRIVEQLGNSTLLYVDTPAGQLIVEGEGNLDLDPGETVSVAIATQNAHLFGADDKVI
jgi:ABC-type sugar transport system ATPase subunit